jgi:hypothetical protein
MGLLDQTLHRIRRNHGLEHATIHVLSEKHKRFSAQGNSDHHGFSLNIYGDVDEEDVETSVQEAYSRLQGGEHQLAVHPNCGTVLLTTATLAALAAQGVLAVEWWRSDQHGIRKSTSFLNALPSAILAATLAIIVSRPLGLFLQANYTVDGKLGNLQVSQVRQVPPSPVTHFFHFLLTGGSRRLQVRSYRIETTDQ